MLQTTACHRSYYRRQADTEATKLITEKATDPHWALPDRTIDIDPRSRMAHPFSADHPPMPPDDPTSNEFMHSVDGKPGFPHWDANGNLDQVENPDWMSFVPVNEKGELVLDLDRAVQVAYLHSPTYQQQRETLYTSALDVSLERFAFDAQMFASYNTFLTADGPVRGGGNSSTTLNAQTGNRGVRLEKLGITGSTLVVGLANTMLWQFAGTGSNATNSLVDFSLIQPLLRGAGRERILESLTQAERTLLANVRQMERYRRGFYLNITTGRNPGQGPTRGGNFLSTPSSQGGGAGGFLGLLQAKQNILIQEYNVSQLRDVLTQFRFMQEAQKIDAFQVTLVERNLYNAQRSLFQAVTNYESTLDQFKITLGLPPEMKVQIEDPLLDRFQLVDPEGTQLQDDLNDLSEEVSIPVLYLGDLTSPTSDRLVYENEPDPTQEFQIEEPIGLRWGDDIDQRLLQLDQYIDKIDAMRLRVLENQRLRVESDIERLRATRPEIIASLAPLADIDINNGVLLSEENGRLSKNLMSESAIADPEILQATVDNAIRKLENDVPQSLLQIRNTIRELQQNHPENLATLEKLKVQVAQSLPQSIQDIKDQSLELLLQQVLARTDLVKLEEVSLTPEVAIAVAKHFRRDWMNARASLVDAWRQIEFQADQLESTFDLVLEGDIGTVGDNPLNFRTTNGRLRGGFRFDSPITRMQERNNYRLALINYQQSRRRYYQVRDEIARNLRQIIRQVQLNKILFELGRLQIKVGVQQVDSARLAIVEPLDAGRSVNPTLGRNLTEAINSLQQAQSSYLDQYVSYEVLRRGLDFDLGTMELDDNSLWIDPGPINREFVDRLVSQDQSLLQELGVDELYDSVDEFLQETAPDLDGMMPNSPMNDPVMGTNEPMGMIDMDSLMEEDDEMLQDLTRRLQAEWARRAREKTSQQRSANVPATNAALTRPTSAMGSTARSVSAQLPTTATSQPAIRTSQLPAGFGGAPLPTGSLPTSTLPPVDVSAAFPALGSQSDRRQPDDLSLLPENPSAVSPQRFRPILPESDQP